jgi:tRNA (Thr-GGU) A37 N-methylase
MQRPFPRASIGDDWMINYQPIGIIRTPFKEPQGTPIQPTGGEGVKGIVEVYPKYQSGLKDIEGFPTSF